VSGIAEKCTIDFIIRDFITEGLKKKEEFLKSLVEMVMENYPTAGFEFTVTEQYRNMKEVLDKHPEITEFTKEAMQRAGVPFERHSARGGTDGSRLSFMGLPCPDIFTGEMAFHSKHEYISVQDMNKSVETIVHLAVIWEEKS
jgi:tripeptide aminopeptidase